MVAPSGENNDDGWQAIGELFMTRLRFMRAVDFWAVVLTLPLFAAAGWPLLGWLAGALIWLGQRIVQVIFRQRIARAQEPRKIVGLIAGSTMVRGWGAAIAVLVVGIVSERVGLSAALMIVGLFTVYFAASLLQRLMAGADLRPGGEGR